MALDFSGLLTPLAHLMPKVFGCCLNHQLSAFSPANLTELDWVYFKAMVATVKSMEACSGKSLFLDTMDWKEDLLMMASLRFCCKETPYTCLVSVNSGVKFGSICKTHNDTVRDFLGDDLGSWQIDNVGESNPVTERGHSVGASGSGVGIGQWGQVLNVVDEVDLLFGVQQVDVTWGTGENLEWQWLTGWNESLGWLLVWVGTVSQWQLGDTFGVLLSEEVGDGGVVVGGVLEGLEGQLVSQVGGNTLGFGQFLQEFWVTPPMSISSTASSMVTEILEMVSLKGYKLHTTKSTFSMPCLSKSASSDSKFLAKIPPWTAGCKVLTLPPSISGAWVMEETSSTGKPASLTNLAVPPEAKIRTLLETKPLAKSNKPVLS
ncbi:hypothetical protein WICPIJ_000461 [Wickerhamomyces pijperi]|uniref:Uncharacterized protein n=1 Tax=Wickerhamomyces pijperi TaxID=599730 RepID=A0A9P8QGI6_WICPI|nr:hypothetical protein WICPIJ_000461 [Wickerhamomyces pijperi]